MMDIYWLEQNEADVPPENSWLGANEAVCLNRLRFAKRRTDWRLGRWTAKRALAGWLNLPGDYQGLAEIEIRPAPSGAPEVFLANQPAEVTMSLSHRDGVAICAVAPSGVALGCDLEVIELRSDVFVADYFTTEEQALVGKASADDRSLLLAMLWSAKESTLKALRTGLRLDTRAVTVSLAEALRGRNDTWRPLQARHADGQIFHGWWQQTGNLIKTLVAAPAPLAPILLHTPSGR